MLTIRAFGLSGLRCRSSYRYHCLTSVVNAARTVSSAAVLLIVIVRRNYVSLAYWW